MAADVATRRMTLNEYFALPCDGTLIEWVAGEAVFHLSASALHQQVVQFMYMLLQLFTNLRRTGRVFLAPYAMMPTPQGPVREPDIMVITPEHLDRVQDRWLTGAPDLAVEVLSDDSLARDRSEKFDEYEAAGVREYWVVDPRPGRERADFWVLDRGRYRAIAFGDDGTYRCSVLPGFWLKTAWLVPGAMPDPLRALGEMVGPEALIAALRPQQD